MRHAEADRIRDARSSAAFSHVVNPENIRPAKHGGNRQRVELDDQDMPIRPLPDEIIALDDALTILAKIDERKSRIVELRFFGGLSVKESAEVMQLSEITVIREWNKAKAWLYRELSKKEMNP